MIARKLAATRQEREAARIYVILKQIEAGELESGEGTITRLFLR
jgi:hypothetical protein